LTCASSYSCAPKSPTVDMGASGPV